MSSAHRRNKPTTSFTLEQRHVDFLDSKAVELKSTRSWVLGRILDLFMASSNNLVITHVGSTNDEQAAD
jgi:hypothetical protein